jgi:hypothetical protein
MNCHTCGKTLGEMRATVQAHPDDRVLCFCSKPCLLAYLGPDRPLTRRIESGQSERSTPQDVVVGGFRKYQTPSDPPPWSKEWWKKHRFSS